MPFPLLSAATASGPPRWLESLPYQVVGLCVVFTAVGLVWLLMEGMGLIFRWLERKVEPPAAPLEVAPPALPPPPPPESVSISPASPGPAQLPALSEPATPPLPAPAPSLPDSVPPPAPAPPIVDGVAPEVVVVISAAVFAWIDAGVNIVSIVPLDRTHEQNLQPLAWSNEGRRQHFASHKVR